jgi:hypothetical protein
MTSEQSKKLKVGTLICFNGDQTVRGTVTAIHANYVTIKWDERHRSLSGHNDMKRVELASAKQ